MTGGQIGNQHGNKERRDSTRSLFEKDLMILLKGGQPSQSCADNDTDTVRIFRSDLEPGILDGFLGGPHGILNEEIHLLDLFLIDITLRAEVLDLCGNLRVKTIRIEPRERTNARFSLADILPGRLDTNSDGDDEPHPCDHNPSFQIMHLP